MWWTRFSRAAGRPPASMSIRAIPPRTAAMPSSASRRSAAAACFAAPRIELEGLLSLREARAGDVAFLTASGRRMKEDQRILGQMLAGDRHEIARLHQPRGAVADRPLSLPATRAQPLIGEGEALAA